MECMLKLSRIASGKSTQKKRAQCHKMEMHPECSILDMDTTKMRVWCLPCFALHSYKVFCISAVALASLPPRLRSHSIQPRRRLTDTRDSHLGTHRAVIKLHGRRTGSMINNNSGMLPASQYNDAIPTHPECAPNSLPTGVLCLHLNSRMRKWRLTREKAGPGNSEGSSCNCRPIPPKNRAIQGKWPEGSGRGVERPSLVEV